MAEDVHGAAYSIKSKRPAQDPSAHAQRRPVTELYEQMGATQRERIAATEAKMGRTLASSAWQETTERIRRDFSPEIRGEGTSLGPPVGGFRFKGPGPETPLPAPTERHGASYKIKSTRSHEYSGHEQPTTASGKYKRLNSAIPRS